MHITVKRQEYVTSDTKHLPPDQQEKRTTFKVSELKKWENGPTLSLEELDEDVPF